MGSENPSKLKGHFGTAHFNIKSTFYKTKTCLKKSYF